MRESKEIASLNQMFEDVKQRQNALYLIDQNELTSKQQKELEFAIFSNGTLICEIHTHIKDLKTPPKYHAPRNNWQQPPP